jgi:hypothetical protein
MKNTVQLDLVQSALVQLALERYEIKVQEASKAMDMALASLRTAIGVPTAERLTLDAIAKGVYTASWDIPEPAKPKVVGGRKKK